MAIDPRISLAVKQANVAPAIDLFNRVKQQRIQNQALPGQMLAQDLSNRLREQQIARGGIDLENAENQRDIASLAQFSILNKDALQQAKDGDSTALQQALQARIQQLGPERSQQSQEALQLIQAVQGQQAARLLGNSVDLAVKSGLLNQSQLTAGQRDRQALIADLQSDDPNIVQSAKVALGIAPRAATSAQERIATDTDLTKQVAGSQAQIAGAQEEAKLQAKVKLEPQLQANVNKAKAEVKRVGDQLAKDKSNDSAFRIYQTGIQNLSEALGQTSTGFFSGLLPAFTSEAQTAQGAISVMAPVLKQMFRGAGEGTFTDKDQELLLAMIPTRSDNPEAIDAKLKSLDSVVRAKLGQPLTDAPTTDPGSQIEQPQQSQPTVIRFDAQGNMINGN